MDPLNEASFGSIGRARSGFAALFRHRHHRMGLGSLGTGGFVASISASSRRFTTIVFSGVRSPVIWAAGFVPP
jgi:hypothetical protein